jgi:hypothetical protein
MNHSVVKNLAISLASVFLCCGEYQDDGQTVYWEKYLTNQGNTKIISQWYNRDGANTRFEVKIYDSHGKLLLKDCRD